MRAPDDAALANSVELTSIEAAALARHPSLVEAAHRVPALAAQARSEGSLPAPELMAELWQVPLSRPYAVQDAQMLMLSLQQEIPAAGSLDHAAEAAALEARAAGAMVAAQARALLREVDRTYADYVETTGRHAAHVEHVTLLEQMAAAARARYAAGGLLADFTKADLEQARMQADIAREHAAREEARARLNGLLGRAAGAELGPPRAEPPVTVRLTEAQAADRAVAKNPEVVAADTMREAARSSASAAEQEGTIPSFKVGLSYFAPVGGMPNGWGASFGMSLPWLWGRASSHAESADQRVLAEGAAAQGARLRVGSEAAKAIAAVKGSEKRLVVLRDQARAAVQRALDATRAGYAAGGTDFLTWLDAERSSLDVAIELVMARGDLDRALADLDWAVGERVARVPLNPSTETPR